MSKTGGFCGVILSSLLALTAWTNLSCAGGGGAGGGLSGAAENLATDDGESIASSLGGNFTIGSRVGEFELSAPAGDPAQGNAFLLHGMLPVPQSAFPPSQTPTTWLGVLDSDGSMQVAQLERATRYGNGDTAVFEVLARVHRDPSRTPGTRVIYPVHLLHDPTGASFQTAGPTHGVPTEIGDLASGARKILIVASDCFGNKYYSAPLGMHNKKVFREGPYQTTARSYSTLKPYPAVAGSQGTLPGLLGVHAFVTQSSGSNVLGLDLRIHNGMVGENPQSQDPIRPVYVQSVQIYVPAGFTVLNSLNDPHWSPQGVAVTWNGKDYTSFDIVKPLAGGKMHVIDKLAQTHRRLAVTVTGNETLARASLDLDGLAFNRQGVDPANPQQSLWSWWNPQTSNFMQGGSLPHMIFWGAAALRNDLANKFQGDKSVFESGSVTGVYPWNSPGGPLGGQSGGVQYGGMTGGTDIFMNNGVDAAFAGSREAIRHAALLHQAYANRQPNVLFKPDGSPLSILDIQSTNASGPCVLFKFFLFPEGSYGLNYFKLSEPANFQENYVANQNLKPSYEADHFAFMCQDYQHQIRYTRHLFTLAFLSNDPLAKEDLEAAANNARLAEPELRICGNNNAMGVLAALQFGNASPGTASGYFGRGQGWITYANTLYYAMANDAWRAQTRPWLDMTVDAAQKVQVPCTGVLYAMVSSKTNNPNARVRQHFEQMIWNNSLAAMLANVYEGTGSPKEATVRHVLEESAYSFVRPVAWLNGQGPWKFLAVSDLNPATAPNYCNLPLPPNSVADIDNYMLYDTFAHGFRMTGDATFIAKAIEISGGNMNTLKAKLETVGYNNNIENNAQLLRLMQELGWVAP